MVIIWGTTHAGKVDEVPGGMFHVVTRFGHLYYIPLFPTASFAVLEKLPDGGINGAAIPLSLKSILAGWLRAGCVVAIIAAGISLLLTIFSKHPAPFAWALPLVVGCLGGGVLFLTYQLRFFRQASYERAKDLAQLLALNDVGLLMLEVTYGRLTAAQAEAELARREAQAANQQPIAAELAAQPSGF